jgi:hypothetical protein
MDFVVDKDSAAPIMPGTTIIGIESTHSRMCKFRSVTSPGYLTISSMIKRCVRDSPATIQSRWAAEIEARQQRYAVQGREFLAAASLLGLGPQSSQVRLGD